MIGGFWMLTLSFKAIEYAHLGVFSAFVAVQEKLNHKPRVILFISATGQHQECQNVQELVGLVTLFVQI